MTGGRRGRPPAATGPHTERLHFRISPLDAGRLAALTDGVETSEFVRAIIAGAYQSGRDNAVEAAREFLRRAEVDPSATAETSTGTAWEIVREVARSGELQALSYTVRLRSGDWSAVLPGLAHAYMG